MEGEEEGEISGEDSPEPTISNPIPLPLNAEPHPYCFRWAKGLPCPTSSRSKCKYPHMCPVCPGATHIKANCPFGSRWPQNSGERRASPSWFTKDSAVAPANWLQTISSSSSSPVSASSPTKSPPPQPISPSAIRQVPFLSLSVLTIVVENCCEGPVGQRRAPKRKRALSCGTIAIF